MQRLRLGVGSLGGMRVLSFIGPSSREFHSGHWCWSPKKKDKRFNPHEVLGVLETASDEEIRKEYRSLAKKFHPDVCKLPDAQQRFLEIQKAYNMIKTAEAREETQQKATIKDMFDNNVDLDHMEKEEREIVINILNKIEEGVSIIGNTPPMALYEVLKLRNRTSEFMITAASVRNKLPHYIAMASNDYFEEKPHIVKFFLFSRERRQNSLGTITFNTTTQEFEWLSQEEKLIATASLSNSTVDGIITKETFMVKTLGNVVGTFGTQYMTKFPAVISLNSIYLPQKYLPPLEGNRFGLFGSTLKWGIMEGQHDIAASAKREMCQLVGRIFDVDISSHHYDVHPALYLFSVAHNHSLERSYSIGSKVANLISKYWKDWGESDD